MFTKFIRIGHIYKLNSKERSNILKRLFIILFLFMLSFQTSASEMIVKKSDGSTVVFEISDIAEIKFEDITSISSNPGMLKKIRLIMQNIYPNPFSVSANINYSIINTSKVRIDIFNAEGRIIRTLKNETMKPGNYSDVWDAKNNAGEKVVTGAYFARILVDGKNSVKKMIFIK